MVLELEHRRKSGRTLGGLFYLQATGEKGAGGNLMLLQDHPLWQDDEDGLAEDERDGKRDGEVETTFSLGLTQRQRRDREGIVLPYLDAQKSAGERDGGVAGEGGRILYDMGAEDDFDEEEDEI